MLSEASDGFAVTAVERCYLVLALQSELCVSGTHEQAGLFCDFLGDFFVVDIGLVN